MKKVLLIILTLLLINICTPAATHNDYVVVGRKKQTCGTCRSKQTGLAAPQTCMAGCRRERKRFAKPLTRYAQPRIPQKAGYYKTGMNLRYPSKSVCKKPERISASRFNRNHTIVQAKKYSCNGITYYSSKNPCR